MPELGQNRPDGDSMGPITTQLWQAMKRLQGVWARVVGKIPFSSSRHTRNADELYFKADIR